MISNKLGMSSIEFIYTTRLIELYGLTNEQVLSLSFFYCIVSLFMEIPTGFFAEKYGSKYSIVLGSMFWFLGQSCYAFGSNYGIFILGQVLLSLGGAFLSGALDCWIGFKFPDNKQFSKFKRGLNLKIKFIGLLVALVSGFLVDKFDLNWPYYIGMTLFAISFLTTTLFDDTDNRKNQPTVKVWTTTKQYLSNPGLLGLGMLSLVTMACISPVYMLYGPTIKIDMNLSAVWVSIAYALMTFGSLLGAILEKKLSARLELNPYKSEILLQVTKGLGVLLIFVCVKSGILAFLLSCFLMQIANEMSSQFQSNHVYNYFKGHRNEATLASIHSFITRIGGAVGYLSLGILADVYSRGVVFGISGALLVTSSLMVGVTVKYYSGSKVLK